MADRLKTYPIPCKGGLILNLDDYTQASEQPGSATQLINFEPGKYGGYRRLSGYTKYDSAIIPTVSVYGTAIYGDAGTVYGGATISSGTILGVAVFKDMVLAGRDEHLYRSQGTGWTRINGTDYRTAANKWRFTKYNRASETIIGVDGGGYPIKYDGTTYTILNGSGAPTAPDFVEEFTGHIFFGSGSKVQWGAPNQDTVFDAASGGGELNFGAALTGLKKYRDTLYVFARTKISKITGTNLSSFALVPITSDVGCVASDSIQEIDGDLLFLAQDGLRTLAATERIDDIDIASVSRAIQPLLTSTIADFNNDYISSLIVRGKSQYRLFASTPTTPMADAPGILGALREHDEPVEKFEWAETRGIQVTCADSAYIANNEYAIHGGFDGYVYRQEQGNDFNGAQITAIYTTPYYHFGDPALRKTLFKLDTYYRVEGQTTVTVTPNLDYNDPLIIQPSTFSLTSGGSLATYGSAVYNTATYGTTNLPKVQSNLNGSGMAVRFSFSSIGTESAYSIQSLVIQHSIEGRR